MLSVRHTTGASRCTTLWIMFQFSRVSISVELLLNGLPRGMALGMVNWLLVLISSNKKSYCIKSPTSQ